VASDEPLEGTAGPDVTVVIPTRDRLGLLKRSLRSALAQRDISIEIVVVDDGSVDATADWLRDNADARVRVVRHEVPRGVAAARNTGIELAAGEWLAFLDDDDFWAPEKLVRQLDAARAAGASFVYSAVAIVDERGAATELLWAPEPDDILRKVVPDNLLPAGASNVTARRDLVMALGGFDEDLPCSEDWDLWIRMAAVAPAAACNDVLVAYAVHASSTFTRRPGIAHGLERLAAKHRELTSALGVEFDEIGFSRWVAYAYRRAGQRVAAARVYFASGVRYRNAGNLVRGIAVLFGEPTMNMAAAVARGLRGSPPTRPAATPSGRNLRWLDAYR
jgi:glycosyltransferase involved in cell wall biosynthesis